MIISRASLHKIEHTIQAHIHTCISANFKDHHGTPTAFLTNFTKTVKLTKTLIACNYWRWNSFSCDYFKKSWKLLESGFPDRYFGRSMWDRKPYYIVNCHRTACMPAHAHKCMHMRFAWWAMLGSLFPNMACPNSDTWRVRIQIFFFFFSFFFSIFLRVSQMSFLKLRVTRATRAFYTGEKGGLLHVEDSCKLFFFFFFFGVWSTMK